jgi:NitT/TauT family transport system permease protein
MRPSLVIALRILIVAAFALVWELLSRSGWINPRFLPPLSTVLATAGELIQRPSFVGDMALTAFEVIVAFVIVAPLGLAVGFYLGENRDLERSLSSFINVLMALPKSILIPLLILIFGIGFTEKIVYTVLLAFFVIMPAAIAAVRSIPPDLIVAAIAFGATRRQLYTRIYVPAVAPIVMSGLRLGMIFTITGVLFAEMYASANGIGSAIMMWGQSFKLTELLASVLMIIVFTIALNEGMQYVESRVRSRFSLQAAE